MKYDISGLSDQEVAESRKKYGSNELTPYELESFWSKLLGNLKDPIIIILIVALFVILLLSFFGLTEWYEAVAIGVAVALATMVSTFSEFKNESSFQKLQEEASMINNLVFRGGQIKEIPVNDIVTLVGDSCIGFEKVGKVSSEIEVHVTYDIGFRLAPGRFQCQANPFFRYFYISDLRNIGR